MGCFPVSLWCRNYCVSAAFPRCAETDKSMMLLKTAQQCCAGALGYGCRPGARVLQCAVKSRIASFRQHQNASSTVAQVIVHAAAVIDRVFSAPGRSAFQIYELSH
jgi:hypothetical protein